MSTYEVHFNGIRRNHGIYLKSALSQGMPIRSPGVKVWRIAEDNERRPNMKLAMYCPVEPWLDKTCGRVK